MAQDIATIGYIAFVTLALISPFLPLFLMWRAAGLAVAFYAIASLLEGPVHWTEQDFGWAIGQAILVLFSFAIALLIALRLCFSTYRGQLKPETLAGSKGRPMRALDLVFLGVVGGFTGLLLTLGLSMLLSGQPFGGGLDRTIAVLTGASGAALLIFSRANTAIVFSTALGTISITAFMGSAQADRILTGAEELSEGRPWCLTSGTFSSQISSVGELGFFAMRKSTTYPHLGILVRENGMVRFIAHWSIRQQRFVPAWGAIDTVSACVPITDYADTLQSGAIDEGVYAVGSALYAIPADFQARVTPRRISIRSTLLVGTDSVHPKIAERVSLTENASDPSLPEDALSLEMMPNPAKLSASDFTHPNHIRLAGIEERTGRTVILDCLSGPYADELCRAQVFEGSRRYDFLLPFRRIQNWSEATDQIAGLFEGFRLTQASGHVP